MRLLNRRAHRIVIYALVAGAIFVSGCKRSAYRKAADKEANGLVEEKSNNPRWALPGFNINIDPRSRFYDPYNPDCPPMPPDDPISHQYMHCVHGMRGYKHWHAHGDIEDLENPGWRQQLEAELAKDEDGKFKLTLDHSIELAIRNSPDFQEQLETLYLSSLDVSTERFRFDVQFFGGNFTQFENRGSEAPGGGSSNIQTDTGLQLQKQFATAGELLVGFANSTVWEFFGPNRGVTTSILNFSLVQPLLRAGGRVIALEQLTIAERALLANLRAFAMYRTGFYTNIAIGELGVAEPQRQGGFFGGTGLTGFTGQGSGGFGGVGDATGFGRAGLQNVGGNATGGGAGFAGGGAGQVGGYLGLLQQLQQIHNTEQSLRLQLRTLALLEANLNAGLIDIAQVDQFRQNIETERANLLQARNAYQASLDTFCRTNLGLPPDFAFEPDASLIKQFQFVDPAISRLQNEITVYIDAFGELAIEPPTEDMLKAFRRVDELRTQTGTEIDVVPQDLRDLEAKSNEREIRMSMPERESFRNDRRRLAESYAALRTRFEQTGDQLKKLRDGLKPENRRQTADSIVALLTDLSNIINELSLIQARARLEMITTDPVNLASNSALDIARANRLDWMNNRASLVDTWRLIEFNANALKSDFTIRFSGDIRTLPNGDNPIKLRDEAGSLRASFEFDPPLTRLVERNNFRQQLIEYQQDRRDLIRYEDRIHQTLRQILRDIEQLSTNLEIQRRAVAIAIRRVDQTRETLNKPIPPAAPGAPPSALGPTSAQNLLFALSDLRNTQNNLMSVWLNYHASRMRLYRELGVMRLDERGTWIDEPLEMSVRVTEAESPLPPSVPSEWLQEDGKSGDPTAPDAKLPGPNPSVPPSPAPDAAPPNDLPPEPSALNFDRVTPISHVTTIANGCRPLGRKATRPPEKLDSVLRARSISAESLNVTLPEVPSELQADDLAEQFFPAASTTTQSPRNND